MKTPSYTKWFNGSAYATLPLSAEHTIGTLPVSGQFIDNAGPPSDPELTWFYPEITIPFEADDEGNPISVFAEVIITYRVDDWGKVALAADKYIIELIAEKEAPGPYGGHQLWEKKYRAILPSGTHTLSVLYQNINMPDNSINRKVCELYWTARKLEAGGRKDPQPCECSGDTCSPEGGTPPETRSTTAAIDSSSAASSVSYDMTEDSLVWSCNMGVLRGLGTSLNGKLQLCCSELSEAQAGPTALQYSHPVAATLSIPEGGVVAGAVLNLNMGVRTIRLYCDADGSVRPQGVDTAGLGLATLTTEVDGTPIALRWQDATGAAWLFSASTGVLLSYTGPEMVTVENVTTCLCVKRSADNSYIRQIWSYWDGLVNVEDVTSTGYSIALYHPSQVTGTDADGYYTLSQNATAFKRFNVNATTNGLTIVEKTPLRDDFVCTWTRGGDGSWSMVKGVAEEAVSTTRVRTVLESASTTTFEVWQMVTTISKGGVPASRRCEIYQSTPVGNLLLTAVEGYGSESEQITRYEYDGVGDMVLQTAPNGHTTEYWYDESGRIVKTFEPWGAGDYTLITDYVYAHSSAERYSSELATLSRKLRHNGTNTMVTLSTESYTYSVANGIYREEIRSTAAGSSHTHLQITETWTNDAPTALDRGRPRMTQAVNGQQQWYTYTAASQYGAIYTITSESRINDEPVPGHSRRTVSYINTSGNVTREEEYILLSSGTWQLLSGSSHTYNAHNQRIRTVHDNGRSSSRELNCDGELLWEVDENGIRTDYAYDSARRLIETTRSEVKDGNMVVTPETITEFNHDAVGRVISVTTHTGPLSVMRSTSYDLSGRRVSETDELGRITTTSYSVDGLTTTVSTPSGATLISTYNTDGTLAHVSGTGQRELYYTYALNGNNTEETIRLADKTTILSQTITNGFDENIVEAVASTTGFIYTRREYNAVGLVTKNWQDTGSNSTPTAATFSEYDNLGRITKKTLALTDTPTPTNSPVEEYTRTTELTEDGVYAVTMHTRYNTAGAPLVSVYKQFISKLSDSLESKSVSINERNLISTQWSVYHAGAGRVSYSTVPGSSITAESVTVDGFIISQKDNAGITTAATRTYTATGIVYTQTDGRGNTTTTTTDIAGRSIRTVDAADNVTVTTYSSCCDRPTTITDAQGNTTCYSYDVRGRKLAEWGTGIQPVCYAYDEADNLVSRTTFRVPAETISTNPIGRTGGDMTTWIYHPAAGVELSKTYANGKGVTRTYDAFNRLLTETDGRGVVKTYSYEHARGLLLGTTYSLPIQSSAGATTCDATIARSFAYNHLGMLTQVIDDAGSRTLTYNSYNEPESDILLAGNITHLITEQRDNYGRSAGYTYAKNGTVQQMVSTGYGEDGRIISAGFVHGGAQKLFTYNYLSGTNLLQTLEKPNNMTLTQSYEDKRDLLICQLYKRDTTTVASRTYSYDSLGRPVTRSTSKDEATVNDSFGYNSRSELNIATVNNETYAYDYDNIGNRVSAQKAAETVTVYATNSLNQYTNIGDFVPSFDDAGNQTLVKTSTGIWSVTYDAENRPTLFTNADSSTIVECTYDYIGRRATKKVTVNGSITLHQRYIYRGYLQIACCDLTRSAQTALWLITWDPTQTTATRPLAIQINGIWFTYGWDLTKNICEVYGQHGYIRTNYTYSPYGSVIMSGDLTQPMQWSSEYNDTELALVYYNYRHYNPTEGRWLGRDRIKSQYIKGNEFVFVSNHSLYSSDYLGKLEYENFFIDHDSWKMFKKYQDNKVKAGNKIESSQLYPIGKLNSAIYYNGTVAKEFCPFPTWENAFYDIDEIIPNLSDEILNEIEIKHEIIDKVYVQINNKLSEMSALYRSKKCGKAKWVYRTENSYYFGWVRYALGSGTVSTITYITQYWKEYTFASNHGSYWWEGYLNIYYSDIFEEPFKYKDSGLDYESGEPYAYFHKWDESNAFVISRKWGY